MKNKKTATNLRLEANIIKALNHLRNNYSYTDPKRFDAEAIFREVKLTRVFSTIIKNLGIIEYPIPAHVVLTNKIDIITPREIHLALNEYQYASQKRAAKKKQKIKARELAKIQAQIRFENKQKLRGANKGINNDALIELLRNAPSLPKNEVTNMQVPPYPQGVHQAQSFVPNLFDVQGAFYPQPNDMAQVNSLIAAFNSFLPKGYNLEQILNGVKAAMRQEIKDELRREIINELISKG